MKPIYIKVEKKINQPIEKVWETVALGFGNVNAYNPEIKSSRFDSVQESGVGTRRHCDFSKKGYIKEQIIAWDDKVSFKLKLVKSSVPLEMLESKFSFKMDNDHTIIIQEMWYKMKAPMGWLSGLMKRKMKNTLINGLNGLNDYLNNQ